MFYRRKPKVVTAEVYRPGLEDGFEPCLRRYTCKSKVKCADCGCSIPYVQGTEVVNGRRCVGARQYIFPDDYIITAEDGSKSVVSLEEFYKEYERCE